MATQSVPARVPGVSLHQQTVGKKYAGEKNPTRSFIIVVTLQPHSPLLVAIKTLLGNDYNRWVSQNNPHLLRDGNSA